MKILKLLVFIFAAAPLNAGYVIPADVTEKLAASSTQEARLINAVLADNVKGVQAALASGINLKEKGPIFGDYLVFAVATDLNRFKANEILNLFVKNGADINAADRYGNHMINYLSNVNDSADARLIEKAITEYKAQQDLPGADGCTPLLTAVATNYYDVVDILLRHKAAVNARDAQGKTALFKTDTKQVAAKLIAAGININAQDNKGNTALMIHIERGDPEIVTLLLNHGANLKLKNKKGQDALAVANACEDADIAQLILNRR